MRIVVSRLCVLGLAALLIPACGGSKGQGGHGSSENSVPTCVVPGTGGRFLESKGGTGNAGAGGAGGAINISSTSGSDLSILAGNLTVDVGFTIPTFTPNLGTNPLTFLTPGPETLTPPLVPSPLLGNDGLTAATGLHVGPGVTLTIATNSPSPGLRTDVVLTFPHSVWIEGTLVTAHQDVTTSGDAASLSAAHLSIRCSNYLGTKVSSIDTRGTGAGVLEVGGNGGNVLVRTLENLVNEGTIAASGGNAGASSLSGGKGGAVGLAGGDFLFCTGDITTNGGTTQQALAFGGAAGNIVLIGSNRFGLPNAVASWYSGCNVRGSLTARGGDGGAGGGAGAGGVNPLVAAPAGIFLINDMVLGGNSIFDVAIDASGGNATVDGNGGSGATANPAGVVLRGESGSLRALVTVINRGGNGAGGGNGGAGGSFSARQITEVGPSSSTPPALVGGMSLALDVDTGGGNGGVGGPGGTLSVIQQLNGLPPGLYPVILAGVEHLDSSGGQGTSQGGLAGAIAVSNVTHSDQFGNKALGAIRNEAELTAIGGAGTAGAGGAGNSITLATSVPPIDNVDFGSTHRSVKNTADLTTTGGTGTTSGGGGGAIKLFDHFKTINWGNATSSGGAGGSSTGGTAGSILVGSDRFVTNFGDLTAAGGSSTSGAGGNANEIAVATVKTFQLTFGPLGLFGTVFGEDGEADNRGALTATGGNGGTVGGSGLNAVVFDHFKAVNSGPIIASGGTGGSGNGGFAGAAWILSDVRAINDAAATANGGGSTGGGNGAAGGIIAVISLHSRQSGDCTAKGGNGAIGGNGGFIQFHSATPPTTVHGTMTVTQGTGGTPIVGSVVRDGIDQILTAGVVTFP